MQGASAGERVHGWILYQPNKPRWFSLLTASRDGLNPCCSSRETTGNNIDPIDRCRGYDIMTFAEVAVLSHLSILDPYVTPNCAFRREGVSKDAAGLPLSHWICEGGSEGKALNIELTATQCWPNVKGRFIPGWYIEKSCCISLAFRLAHWCQSLDIILTLSMV